MPAQNPGPPDTGCSPPHLAPVGTLQPGTRRTRPGLRKVDGSLQAKGREIEGYEGRLARREARTSCAFDRVSCSRDSHVGSSWAGSASVDAGATDCGVEPPHGCGKREPM
eukprot:7383539-Prymnesium_polylepis.2